MIMNEGIRTFNDQEVYLGYPNEIKVGQGGLFIKGNEELGAFDQIHIPNESFIKTPGIVDPENRRGPISYNADQAMRRISKIVTNACDPKDPMERYNYQLQLNSVLHDISNEFFNRFNKNLANFDDAVFIAPLRGGEMPMAVLRTVARQNGTEIPIDQIAHMELKRAKVAENRFIVGERNHFMPKITKSSKVILIDDCVATNISVVGALGSIYSQFPDFNPQNMYLVASTGYQLALDNLHRLYGIQLENMIIGTNVYAINEKGYLIRTAQEGFKHGDPYVADMGVWTEKLPHIYNKLAPWNTAREQLQQEWQLLGY